MREQLPDEFLPDFDTIYALLNKKVDTIVAAVEEEAQKVATWSDKEVGLGLPKDIRSFVFSYRKSHGNILAGLYVLRGRPSPFFTRQYLSVSHSAFATSLKSKGISDNSFFIIAYISRISDKACV